MFEDVWSQFQPFKDIGFWWFPTSFKTAPTVDSSALQLSPFWQLHLPAPFRHDTNHQFFLLRWKQNTKTHEHREPYCLWCLWFFLCLNGKICWCGFKPFCATGCLITSDAILSPHQLQRTCVNPWPPESCVTGSHGGRRASSWTAAKSLVIFMMSWEVILPRKKWEWSSSMR